VILISFGSQKQAFGGQISMKINAVHQKVIFDEIGVSPRGKHNSLGSRNQKIMPKSYKNSMHNGMRQTSMSKIWKTRLWGRKFVLQGTLRRLKADTRCIQVL